MMELGSFIVGTGGLLIKDPRHGQGEESVHIPKARSGWWNTFLQKDGDLICALILTHDSVDPQKTQPEWQDSIGNIPLTDDSIGVWNQTKFEAHREELLPDFGTLMSEETGFCVDKHGVMAIAGQATSDCEVYTDTDKKARVIAVKVIFWDEKENWGDADDGETRDDDDGPSEYGWGGDHDQDDGTEDDD